MVPATEGGTGEDGAASERRRGKTDEFAGEPLEAADTERERERESANDADDKEKEVYGGGGGYREASTWWGCVGRRLAR